MNITSTQDQAEHLFRNMLMEMKGHGYIRAAVERQAPYILSWIEEELNSSVTSDVMAALADVVVMDSSYSSVDVGAVMPHWDNLIEMSGELYEAGYETGSPEWRWQVQQAGQRRLMDSFKMEGDESVAISEGSQIQETPEEVPANVQPSLGDVTTQNSNSHLAHALKFQQEQLKLAGTDHERESIERTIASIHAYVGTDDSGADDSGDSAEQAEAS